MKRIPSWTLLALASLVTGACGDDDSAIKTDRLVYQADTSPTTIMVVHADGSNKVEVGKDIPGLDRTNPDWSPDGTRLVFAVTNNGVDSLWTVNADGTGAAMLLECVDPCLVYDDPAWSPDGTKVLYSRTSEVDGKSDAALETVDVADFTVTEVLAADSEHLFSGARYSPDGTSIVFEHVHKQGTAVDAEVDGVELTVLQVAAPASTLTVLAGPDTFPVTPDWGPNGDLIVFSALADPSASAPDLFTIQPDGSGLTRVTTLADAGGAAEEPAWSGDGTTIHFTASLPDGVVGIAVVPTGGGVKPALGDTYQPGRHPRVHAADRTTD
jgi:Tol biopolymer transport system component